MSRRKRDAEARELTERLVDCEARASMLWPAEASRLGGDRQAAERTIAAMSPVERVALRRRLAAVAADLNQREREVADALLREVAPDAAGEVERDRLAALARYGPAGGPGGNGSQPEEVSDEHDRQA